MSSGVSLVIGIGMTDYLRSAVIAGPGHAQDLMDHITRKGPHRLIGDGVREVTLKEIEDLSVVPPEPIEDLIEELVNFSLDSMPQEIEPESPFTYRAHAHLWGHGHAENGKHYIEVVNGISETEKVLEEVVSQFPVQERYSLFPLPRRVIHVWSCHAGAAKDVSSSLPHCSLILHSGKKHTTLMAENTWGIRHHQEFYDEVYEKKLRPPKPEEVFIECIKSPETVIFSQNGKSFKTHAPKEPVTGEKLKEYLEREIQRFNEFLVDLKQKPLDINTYSRVIDEKVLESYCERAMLLTLMRTSSKEEDKGKYIERVEHYLKAGINPDAELIDGKSALKLAIKEKDMDMLGLLMKYNADPFKRNSDGLSAIDYAIKWNYQEAISTMLFDLVSHMDVVKHRKDIIHLVESMDEQQRGSRNAKGGTVLHVAAEKLLLLTQQEGSERDIKAQSKVMGALVGNMSVDQLEYKDNNGETVLDILKKSNVPSVQEFCKWMEKKIQPPPLPSFPWIEEKMQPPSLPLFPEGLTLPPILPSFSKDLELPPPIIPPRPEGYKMPSGPTSSLRIGKILDAFMQTEFAKKHIENSNRAFAKEVILQDLAPHFKVGSPVVELKPLGKNKDPLITSIMECFEGTFDQDVDKNEVTKALDEAIKVCRSPSRNK